MEAEERPNKIRRLSHPQNDTNGFITHELSKAGPDRHDKNQGVDSTGREKILDGISSGDALCREPASQAKDLNDAPQTNSQDAAGTGETLLSKNQLKKIKRKQDWEAGRDYRKAKRKEKTQERKQRKREARDKQEENSSAVGAFSPSTAVDGGISTENKTKQGLQPRHLRSVQLPITFVLDCNFDDLMLDKERISLASQLTRCYSDNYRASFKAHMVISSFGGHLKERFDTILAGHHQSWKGVRFLSEDFVSAASQAQAWMASDQGGELAGVFARKAPTNADSASLQTGEVIYLTSDSPETLTELKPYSTYIIGGLVDKNREKGICYKRAMEAGLKTAKLPIGEYMQMTSRFVLATNHVVEIMLKWLELGDWGEAFLRVMPKRKGGVLKVVGKGDAQVEGESDVDEDVGAGVQSGTASAATQASQAENNGKAS